MHVKYDTYDNSIFEEVMERYQAIEYSRIPQEVIVVIKKEFGNNTPPNREMIKELLKKNGFAKYVDQTNMILRKIYGVTCSFLIVDVIDEEHIKTIKKMYEELYEERKAE